MMISVGYGVEAASIAGGEPPRHGYDPDSDLQADFLAAIDTTNTPRLSDVDPADYALVHFVGGHGAMWDFAYSDAVTKVVNDVYSRGGIVSPICHGQAAFVGLRRPDGQWFVDGICVTAYSNAEEEAIGLTNVVPFLLEDEMIKQGGLYSNGPEFGEHVVADRRVVTGQNGQSVQAFSAVLVEELAKVTG